MPDDRFVMEEIARGLQGPPGPQGPQGPAGADGTVSFDDLTPEQKASLNELGISGASVGDLVRVAAVDANGKPTSWNHVPLCDILTNKNLLDNWYFVGGGSQLGDGIFPINLQGKTVYPGAGYSIGRWNASNSNGTLTITQDSVTLSASSSGNAFFRQPVKKLQSNAVITISALIKGSGSGVLRVDNETGTSTIFNAQSYSNPGSELTLISGSGTLPDGVGIVTLRANASTAIDIVAIKCEFGTEQTLAHQEGGVWVLNEIPDWAEEMAACQRYYFPLNTYFRVSSDYVSAGVVDFFIPLPITLSPGFNLQLPNGSVSAYINGAYTAQPGFTFTLTAIDIKNGVMIRASKSNHGLVDSTRIVLQAGADACVGAEVSAN